MELKDKSNFGFKELSNLEKTNKVKEVFSSVYPKYDLMNDIMSLGLHRLWKNMLVSKVENLEGNILDVAGGTGDITFKIYDLAIDRGLIPNLTITDLNSDMLKLAKSKAIDSGLLNKINFVTSGAEDLPFEDNSFDYYIVSFGLRNFTTITKALDEANRVLKPGGKFLCLEFSRVNNVFLQSMYNFYSFNIIPKIGQIITKNRSAYQYLAESIKIFPHQEDLKMLIERAKFTNVKYDNLSYGVCAIHEATKI